LSPPLQSPPIRTSQYPSGSASKTRSWLLLSHKWRHSAPLPACLQARKQQALAAGRLLILSPFADTIAAPVYDGRSGVTNMCWRDDSAAQRFPKRFGYVSLAPCSAKRLNECFARHAPSDGHESRDLHTSEGRRFDHATVDNLRVRRAGRVTFYICSI